MDPLGSTEGPRVVLEPMGCSFCVPRVQCCVFKLRLGALIPRSVCRSVCRSVGLSSKNYKKLQNFKKHHKVLQNLWEDRQLSFGSMPELP